MKKHKIRNVLACVILIGALAGTILCFPIKMDSGQTCLFHKFTNQNADETVFPAHSLSHTALNRYLHSFALIWWLSLLALALDIYYLNLIYKINCKGERENVA
jgi:hypothetical protein